MIHTCNNNFDYFLSLNLCLFFILVFELNRRKEKEIKRIEEIEIKETIKVY